MISLVWSLIGCGQSPEKNLIDEIRDAYLNGSDLFSSAEAQLIKEDPRHIDETEHEIIAEFQKALADDDMDAEERSRIVAELDKIGIGAQELDKYDWHYAWTKSFTQKLVPATFYGPDYGERVAIIKIMSGLKLGAMDYADRYALALTLEDQAIGRYDSVPEAAEAAIPVYALLKPQRDIPAAFGKILATDPSVTSLKNIDALKCAVLDFYSAAHPDALKTVLAENEAGLRAGQAGEKTFALNVTLMSDDELATAIAKLIGTDAEAAKKLFAAFFDSPRDKNPDSVRTLLKALPSDWQDGIVDWLDDEMTAALKNDVLALCLTEDETLREAVFKKISKKMAAFPTEDLVAVCEKPQLPAGDRAALFAVIARKNEAAGWQYLAAQTGLSDMERAMAALTTLAASDPAQALRLVEGAAETPNKAAFVAAANAAFAEMKNAAVLSAVIARIGATKFAFSYYLLAAAQQAQKPLAEKLASSHDIPADNAAMAYVVLAVGHIRETGNEFSAEIVLDSLRKAQKKSPKNPFVLYLEGYCLETGLLKSHPRTGPVSQPPSSPLSSLNETTTLQDVCTALNAPATPPRPESNKEPHAELKAILGNPDDHAKLSLLDEFLSKEGTKLTDIDLFYLVRNMPRGVSWGNKENGWKDIHEAMTQQGLTSWSNEDFRPMDVRILYAAMSKVQSVFAPRQLAELLPDINAVLEQSHKWASWKKEYQTELKKFFFTQHKRLLTLPAFSLAAESGALEAGSTYLEVLQADPWFDPAYDRIKGLSNLYEGLEETQKQAEYARKMR